MVETYLALNQKLSNVLRKSYIHPVKRENSTVTIIAGFRCKDGVVLAADTQISHWHSYSYESKIIDLSSAPHWHRCYMAYSGDTGTAKEISEELRSVISDTSQIDQLAKNLKTALKKLHAEHFSHAPRAEKVELTALIAFPDSQENWKLYCAWGNRFFPVDAYQPLGMGTDTANAVWQPLYSTSLSVQETAILAAYGLGIIKRFVEGCGGKSEIWKLTEDIFGADAEKLDNVDELEHSFMSLEMAQSKLISSLWAFDPEETFEKNFKMFRKELKNIRKRREKALIKESKLRLSKFKKSVSLPTEP